MRTLIVLIFFSVSASAQGVGEIIFDPATDDPKFKLCNADWVWQHYQVKTAADETAPVVAQEIRSKFKPNDAWKNENGMIRVRFLVNCSGQADRFRLLELDFDFNEKQFHPELGAHIISIAKSMQWPAQRGRQQTVDHYRNFSVRIVNGQLNDILQ